MAGYTRGAFYANFKSKEDIFFALLEEWVGQRIAEVNALLAQEDTPAKRLRALRDITYKLRYTAAVAAVLELKLFAIRHPEAARPVAHATSPLRRRTAESTCRRIAHVIGRRFPISYLGAAIGLGALSKSISLEHLVDHMNGPRQEFTIS